MSAIDVESLAAHLEITQVLQRYCRSMDRIDAELGYSVWHEDGIADYGSIFRGTGRGFIDWVCAFHRTLDGQSHQLGVPLIQVHGDRAVSETSVTAALLFTKGGRQQMSAGRARYLDRWSRRNGRWAIDERRAVPDFSVTTRVDVLWGEGKRDRSDLSYTLLGL